MQTKDTTTLKNVRISELAADELIPPAYKLVVSSICEGKVVKSGFARVISEAGVESLESKPLLMDELQTFTPIITSVTSNGVFADITISTSVIEAIQKAGYEYTFSLVYYPTAGFSLRSKIPMMLDGEGSLCVMLDF